VKRTLDFLLAAAGLLVLSPLLLGVAVAIAWSDGWPVFFRQTRVGWRGRDFSIWKFRTMRVLPGAEQGRFDPGTAQRVTRLGQVLRRFKVDELPQLWNVVTGDMALVGPRPEVRKWVEAYPERWALVHTVRPGITDPASIEFRNEEGLLARAVDPERTYREEILPRKLELYEAYVRTHSTWGDGVLILRTLRITLRPNAPAGRS